MLRNWLVDYRISIAKKLKSTLLKSASHAEHREEELKRRTCSSMTRGLNKFELDFRFFNHSLASNSLRLWFLGNMLKYWSRMATRTRAPGAPALLELLNLISFLNNLDKIEIHALSSFFYSVPSGAKARRSSVRFLKWNCYLIRTLWRWLWKWIRVPLHRVHRRRRIRSMCTAVHKRKRIIRHSRE